MRLTRQTLLRIAKESAQKQALAERGLVAAYLTGSLLTDDPFMGHAADIDLVFVHAEAPQAPREIQAVTAEVHLDIVHRSRREYDRPKELRVDPWLGPELYDPLPLYVTEHFFEFVQAGVREKFNDPANVLARARQAADSARRSWAEIAPDAAFNPGLVLTYLKGVNLAADAVSLLSSGPLAERRFLLQFPQRALTAGRPELAAGLLGLLGGGQADSTMLNAFFPAWTKALDDASTRPGYDVRLAAPRRGYYRLACEALLASEAPLTALWPLFLTWTLAACVLPLPWQTAWREACEQLGLSGEAFPGRLEALDAFLDSVEEVLEGFASRNSL
jgi:hypothetical protein